MLIFDSVHFTCYISTYKKNRLTLHGGGEFMKKWLILPFVLFVTVFALLNCGKAQKPEPRAGISLRAAKTSESPVVDGILNETCWKNAPTGNFHNNTGGGEPGKTTKVRIVYDDSNLYIGFECQDPDAASTITGRDSPVSDEEYVAAYIDADCDSTTYVLIEVAPTGAMSDAFVVTGKDGSETKVLRDWDSDRLRASVSVYGGGARPGTDDRFWTVEMAIPFKDFLTAPHTPPLSGQRWRADFFRVELTGAREYYAFAPTESGSFHKPGRFAWLIFGE